MKQFDMCSSYPDVIDIQRPINPNFDYYHSLKVFNPTT